MNWATHCGRLKDQILRKFKRACPCLRLKLQGLSIFQVTAGRRVTFTILN